MAGGAPVYADDAEGQRGVVDIARDGLRGSLEPGDAVRRSWFDFDPDERTVQVVRRGRTVAMLDYSSAENGGSLADGTTTCADF